MIDFPVVDAPTREQIYRFEDAIAAGLTVDIASRTSHTYGPGFYARTLRLNAGEPLTGKIHATEHIFILSKGELLVATEAGRQHLVAPYQMVCRAGLKRAGYAMTDVVVTNIHITEETDLLKLEAALIEPEPLERIEG